MSLSNDYWPEPLKHIPKEKPLKNEMVIVAEWLGFEKPTHRSRNTFTGLVDEEHLEKILNYRGEIWGDIRASEPFSFKGVYYKPTFKINVGDIVPEGIEPLVVGWSLGVKEILVPDNGFLMTYKLVPRLVRSDSDEILYWDDLGLPKYEIVKCKMVYENFNSILNSAYISIHRDYLKDYATLRNKHMIQCYFDNNASALSKEDEKILNNKEKQCFEFPGRSINLTTEGQPHNTLRAVVWGVRHLLAPGELPVTEGYEQIGELKWPGINEPVTENYFGSEFMPYVYIKDTVLAEYESRPDKYDIHPESGSIDFSDQWGVDYCDRVGRDLIRLELKKLYEGAPPRVIRHWHSYAVEPPEETPAQLMEAPNVASRSKRIIDNLLDMGDTIKNIAGLLGLTDLSLDDFVNLKRNELRYYGWWKNKTVFPITCHIPVDIGERQFLLRCQDLEKLIIESLSIKNLRDLLYRLGCVGKKTADYGSLKLLNILTQFAMAAKESGLNLVTHYEQIKKRVPIDNKEQREHFDSPVSTLFLLYDLRIESTHRSDKGIDELLKRMKVDRASLETGWGLLLDKLYDQLGKSLYDITEILKDSMNTY